MVPVDGVVNLWDYLINQDIAVEDSYVRVALVIENFGVLVLPF